MNLYWICLCYNQDMSINNNNLCPVCEQYAFKGRCDHDVCPCCGWENGADETGLEDFKRRYDDYLALIPDYIYKDDGFPEITEKDRLKIDHRFSSYNLDDIAASESCGCFYCCRIIMPEELNDDDWTPEPDGKTALCPYCGIDSLLPGNKVKLSEEYLRKMYDYWFS